MSKVVLIKSEDFLYSLLSECKVEPTEPLFINGKQTMTVRNKNSLVLYVCGDGHLHCRIRARLSTHHHFKKGLISHCNKLCREMTSFLEEKNKLHKFINITYKHEKGYSNGTDVNFSVQATLQTTDGFLANNDYKLMCEFGTAFRALVKSKSLYY